MTINRKQRLVPFPKINMTVHPIIDKIWDEIFMTYFRGSQPLKELLMDHGVSEEDACVLVWEVKCIYHPAIGLKNISIITNIFENMQKETAQAILEIQKITAPYIS